VADPDRAQRFADINERARRAFLEGAAEEWQQANGRPPTEEQLRRILARYPGNPLRPDGTGVDRTATGG
jgi:hypothetical protein